MDGEFLLMFFRFLADSDSLLLLGSFPECSLPLVCSASGTLLL